MRTVGVWVEIVAGLGGAVVCTVLGVMFWYLVWQTVIWQPSKRLRARRALYREMRDRNRW